MGIGHAEVLKYGGSSNVTIDAINNAVGVTAMHKEKGIAVGVVTSAPQGDTDQLVTAIKEALDPNGDYKGIINSFADKHSFFIDNIGSSKEAQKHRDNLHARISETTAALETVRVTGNASLTIHDFIVSLGERTFAPELAGFHNQSGIPAVHVSARDIFIAHDRSGVIEPDISRTRSNIEDLAQEYFEQGIVVIFDGYQMAVSQGIRNVIRTPGRGGSDMSATVLAEAIDPLYPIDGIYLYKGDVDGIKTGDPRIVGDEARLNPHMTYPEVAALSGIGGKVVHSQAVKHAENIGATIYLKGTNSPLEPGTEIDGVEREDDNPIKAVTYLDKLARIPITGKGMTQTGILSDVTTALARAGHDVRMVAQPLSESDLDIVLNLTEDIDSLARAVNRALNRFIAVGDIEKIRPDIVAAIAVVGKIRDPKIIERVYRGLQGTQENPVVFSPGTSSSGSYELSFLLYNEDGQNAENAVRAIHGEIFSTN